MSVEMQLKHYETQIKQFQPLHKEWEREFQQWQDQLQTYPHKDQLYEYEKQWRMWQGQMKATQTHLQEKVKTLQNMNSQYSGNTTVPSPFSSYSQTTQGGMPIVPSTLPAATLTIASIGFSSGPQTSHIPISKESGPLSTHTTEKSKPSLFSTPSSFTFKGGEPLATSQTTDMTRPALLPTPASSFSFNKISDVSSSSQTSEASRPALLPTPFPSSFPYNKISDVSTTSQASEASRPALLPTPSHSSFPYNKSTDLSATTLATELSRPALLPTPSPFPYNKSTDSAATMQHLNATSSISSSGQGSSYIPPGKQAMPFGSVSSELGSVDVKPPSTVPSSSAFTTTTTSTYQNISMRSAGFPDPPRGPVFEGPRGPR